MKKLLSIIVLGLVCLSCTASAPTTKSSSTPTQPVSKPNFEDYATIEAECNGVPVYSLGNIAFIYGVCPDLLSGAVTQSGNTHPIVKIKPKKSWELKDNYVGTTNIAEIRSMWNDDQPMLPIHLIDGDPDTIWMAFGSQVPDERPEWVRIDLPKESTVSAVNLVCQKKSAPGGQWIKAGQLLPKELTIKVSRDAWHWETVYENKNFSGDVTGPNLIKFAPRTAKQIMIVCGNLPATDAESIPRTVSFAEVEVRDPAGTNLALISRGAGVAVSSTSNIYNENRLHEDILYHPVLADLGYKWIRIGPDLGVLLWKYVEREKGKLQVDPKTDAMVTELNRNGINVIMTLDFRGNWLYKNPPQKVDWRRARTREFFSHYLDASDYEAMESPEEFAAYLRYVKYMAERFKGRVRYYELGNEWNNTAWSTDDYMRWAEAVCQTVRTVDPDVKFMLGGPGGTGIMEGSFPGYLIVNCLGPGCSFQAGKLVTPGRAMLTIPDQKVRDAELSMTVKTEAEAGFVLRCQRADNPDGGYRSLDIRFLLAGYDPGRKVIVFHEPPVEKPGTYSNENGVDLNLLQDPRYRHTVPVEGLSGLLKLTAKIENSQVTVTVSDGTKSVQGSYTIKGLNEPGSFGLYHFPMHPQLLTVSAEFDDFTMSDLSGNPIASETFDDEKTHIDKWSLYWNYWSRTRRGAPPAAERFEAVSWHPNPNPDYVEGVKLFKKDCVSVGFKGRYILTELFNGYLSMIYPPGSPNGENSDMQFAKNLSRGTAVHTGMDIASFWCNTDHCAAPEGQTLLRLPNPTDTIRSLEPVPAYYVMRNLSNVLEDAHAQDFPVKFSGDRKLESYTYKRGDNQIMLAAWLPAKTVDGIVESSTDITFPGIAAKKAWAFDTINGTEQELDVTHDAADTVLKRILLKDYPIFFRLVP